MIARRHFHAYRSIHVRPNNQNRLFSLMGRAFPWKAGKASEPAAAVHSLGYDRRQQAELGVNGDAAVMYLWHGIFVLLAAVRFSVTLAFSMGIGVSSVSLLWLIGAPLVREMPLTPGGPEEALYSAATHLDCSSKSSNSGSSSSSKRVLPPFCSKNIWSRKFELCSSSVYPLCPFCLFAIQFMPSFSEQLLSTCCCVHFDSRILAGCLPRVWGRIVDLIYRNWYRESGSIGHEKSLI